MRYNVVGKDGKTIVRVDTLNKSAPLSPDHQAKYMARIRCLDCPGKAYAGGPGHTADNFQLHLSNRVHRANVERRTANTTS